jgi:Flp pilus assembly protein TadD
VQDSTPPRAEQTAAHNATTTQSVSIQSQQESENIDLLLSSAYAAYQKGDYTNAWQRYGEVLTQVPNNRDALLGRAVIAQQQEKDDTALNYYRQVLLLDPRDPVAHAGLSRFDGNSLASRESRLKQLIVQQPDSAALHFALGHQYADQSRWSDAQQAYFNALAMEPSNPLFAFNLAICLDHLGQRKAAAKYYQQALQFSNAGSSGFNRAKAQQRLDELTVVSD